MARNLWKSYFERSYDLIKKMMLKDHESINYEKCFAHIVLLSFSI